jgi:hypothetical protein
MDLINVEGASVNKEQTRFTAESSPDTKGDGLRATRTSTRQDTDTAFRSADAASMCPMQESKHWGRGWLLGDADRFRVTMRPKMVNDRLLERLWFMCLRRRRHGISDKGIQVTGIGFTHASRNHFCQCVLASQPWMAQPSESVGSEPFHPFG